MCYRIRIIYSLWWKGRKDQDQMTYAFTFGVCKLDTNKDSFLHDDDMTVSNNKSLSTFLNESSLLYQNKSYS